MTQSMNLSGVEACSECILFTTSEIILKVIERYDKHYLSASLLMEENEMSPPRKGNIDAFSSSSSSSSFTRPVGKLKSYASWHGSIGDYEPSSPTSPSSLLSSTMGSSSTMVKEEQRPRTAGKRRGDGDMFKTLPLLTTPQNSLSLPSSSSSSSSSKAAAASSSSYGGGAQTSFYDAASPPHIEEDDDEGIYLTPRQKLSPSSKSKLSSSSSSSSVASNHRKIAVVVKDRHGVISPTGSNLSYDNDDDDSSSSSSSTMFHTPSPVAGAGIGGEVGRGRRLDIHILSNWVLLI
jgi:hypothetical protein